LTNIKIPIGTFKINHNMLQMKKIKPILFPTDFSSASLHTLYFAIDLAKKEDTKLIILNVVDESFRYNIEDEPEEVDFILNDLILHSKLRLKEIVKAIKRQHFISVSAITYIGEITQSIARVVNKFNVKKIIMGTKITQDLFLKSSSFNIVKNASVPLLTICEGSLISNFHKILFPFNERLMSLKKADEVIKIAKAYNSKIILLGVAETTSPNKKEIIIRNMKLIKSMFDNLGILNEVYYRVEKDYSKAILDYCSENKIDLITVANDLPTALSQKTKYSAAKNIINNADIPVLTIPVILN